MFRFFRRRYPKAPLSLDFSFCASRGVLQPVKDWHIRKFSSAGPIPGGRADTPSFCGQEVTWDLQIPITANYRTKCCQKCAELYKKQWGAGLTIQADGGIIEE